jgi:uncharacterized cupredoxin-like copper-binding protein
MMDMIRSAALGRTNSGVGRSGALALAAVAMTVVAGCSGTPEPSQTIEIRTGEFDFTSDVVPEIAAGDTVQFDVVNTGQLVHEMQVLDGTGVRLARTPRLAPGESSELVVTFGAAGPHQFICDVDDHLMLGQRAGFMVTGP